MEAGRVVENKTELYYPTELHRVPLIEEMMGKVKNAPTNKEETVVAEQPNEATQTERIKSQVLAMIGKPPRLDHVEVSRHHGRNYRVNIWQQPEPDRHLAVTISPRIKWSYYLTVSDTGEILHSNPPLSKLSSSA